MAVQQVEDLLLRTDVDLVTPDDAQLRAGGGYARRCVMRTTGNGVGTLLAGLSLQKRDTGGCGMAIMLWPCRNGRTGGSI